MKPSVKTAWAPARRPRWLRLPWQPRINTLAEQPRLPKSAHDVRQLAAIVPPASDQAVRDRKAHQYLADQDLARLLNEQFRPIFEKANVLAHDTLALAAHFLAIAPQPESVNPRSELLDLIREFPELDEKGARFNTDVRPNKQQRSPYDLDPDVVQRLGFARYLVQHGTYNEGFTESDAPPQYRTHFSDDDLKRKDN